MIIKALTHDGGGKVTNGVYLHGELEQINGYDLVEFEPPKADGVYGCFVHIKDETYVAKLFYWKAKIDEKVTMNRGLIVSVDNKDDIKYAQEKFKKRACWI